MGWVNLAIMSSNPPDIGTTWELGIVTVVGCLVFWLITLWVLYLMYRDLEV